MKVASFGIVATFLLLLVALIAYNTFFLSYPQLSPHPKFVNNKILPDNKYYESMSRMIQFKTISWDDDSMIDMDQIKSFYRYIETQYPLFWSQVEKEPVGNYSMIFKWKGSPVSSASQLPILLMAHLDVVPAGNEKNWKYQPFSGHITETEIWGRGAIDDKQNILGILEAVTHLLKRQFTPSRDIYMSFGFDEELGGFKSAHVVSEHLRSKNLRFEFIHDEGMPLLAPGMVPGLSKVVAPVCVAEKGSLHLYLSLSGPGGHGSIPPPNSLVGIMSKAVAALEANPLAKQFEGPARAMLESLAPEMSFPLRPLFSNLWLFKPLLSSVLASKPSTNAIISTTLAVTIFQGGNKINVLPSNVTVGINSRISPLHSVKVVLDHITKIVHEVDPNIVVTVDDSLEPAPISDSKSPVFHKFAQVIRTAFPDALVAPALMVGNTDTRHFWGLTDNIYRMAPNILNAEGVATFHGDNERISKENVMNVINFYHQLLLQFNDI